MVGASASAGAGARGGGRVDDAGGLYVMEQPVAGGGRVRSVRNVAFPSLCRASLASLASRASRATVTSLGSIHKAAGGAGARGTGRSLLLRRAALRRPTVATPPPFSLQSGAQQDGPPQQQTKGGETGPRVVQRAKTATASGVWRRVGRRPNNAAEACRLSIPPPR
jgi:hypothetical protein